MQPEESAITVDLRTPMIGRYQDMEMWVFKAGVARRDLKGLKGAGSGDFDRWSYKSFNEG